MTHINNLVNLRQYGILSNHKAHKLGLLKTDISNQDVQKHRERLDPINYFSIHSYVPLYFNPKNPMLYVRKSVQDKIIILVFRAEKVFSHPKTIFSDGNAASKPTEFFSSLSELNKLDWACLNASSYWNDFSDGKRKRCAEVLVPNKILFNDISKIICYNAKAKSEINSKIGQINIEVVIDNSFYFPGPIEIEVDL